MAFATHGNLLKYEKSEVIKYVKKHTSFPTMRN